MQTSSPLQAGQIIWGRFPEMERVHDDNCGKEGRPCLVLETTDYGRDGGAEVLVAYGTSQHTERHGRGEFVLTRQEAPFLMKDTKFCMVRRLWLPFAKFARGGQVDVAGVLPRSALRRVQQAAIEAGLV